MKTIYKSTIRITVLILLLTGFANAKFYTGSFDKDIFNTAKKAAEAQLKQYENQLLQYQNMQMQLQNQIQNLQKLKNYKLGDLNKLFDELEYNEYVIKNIHYKMKDVVKSFNEQFKGYGDYLASLKSADSEASRREIINAQNKKLTEDNQANFETTLNRLSQISNSDDDTKSQLGEAKRNAINAEGEMQILQANTQLQATQADEIYKLRQALQEQTAMQANQLASENNKKILEQAEADRFFTKEPSSYSKKIDDSFLRKQ